MQQTVYKCDECKAEIGKKKHFSLSFSNYSGVAVPPGTPVNSVGGSHPNWRVIPSIQGQFKHFCNPKCLTSFFTKLYKSADVPQNKK